MKEILVMDCEERGAFWLTLGCDCSIHFTTTAEEGLEMLSENIGLIFVSLSLRDMDSMEVIERIVEKYPSTAVVIIAPCGDAPCRCLEAFKKGAWDYMKKPLKATEVLGKISAFIGGGTGLQRNRSESRSTETVMHEQYPDIPFHIAKGVLKVRDFIAQNYSESLSLSEACKMAATSKTYFCRYFKDITGHSLRSYHNLVKVQIAEHFLKDRSLSVTDVAMKLGYHDSNYFSTIYKKITGTPPNSRKNAVHGIGIIGQTAQGPGNSLEQVTPRNVVGRWEPQERRASLH